MFPVGEWLLEVALSLGEISRGVLLQKPPCNCFDVLQRLKHSCSRRNNFYFERSLFTVCVALFQVLLLLCEELVSVCRQVSNLRAN